MNLFNPIYSPDGDVIITNDGATILDKMEVRIYHICSNINFKYYIGAALNRETTGGVK